MSNSPVTYLDEQVASEIRAVMGRQRLSARGLARKIGTNDVWVSRRLRGSVGITFGDLQEISQALGVPWWTLLPRLDSNQQPAGTKQRRRSSVTASEDRPRLTLVA